MEATDAAPVGIRIAIAPPAAPASIPPAPPPPASALVAGTTNRSSAGSARIASTSIITPSSSASAPGCPARSNATAYTIAAAGLYSANATSHADALRNHCIPISVFENAATSGSVPTSSTSIPPRTSISMIWMTVARKAMIPSAIAINAVVTVPASPTVNPAGAPATRLVPAVARPSRFAR